MKITHDNDYILDWIIGIDHFTNGDHFLKPVFWLIISKDETDQLVNQSNSQSGAVWAVLEQMWVSSQTIGKYSMENDNIAKPSLA